MNMVRIRHIMEMRRACKAPPLLPPKLKKTSCDILDRKTGFKEILDIHLSLRCDWTENEVTPLGSAYFLISEIVAQGVVVRNLTNEGTGVTVGQMSVGSTVKPKPPPLMLQFECKGFSRKIVPDAAVLSFEVVRNETDGEKTLLYKSEMVKQSARMVWKAFTLPSQDVTDEAPRPIEIICYFKDEKYRSGIAGSFTTTHNELRDAQEPFTLTNPVYKGGMKVCGQFELVKRTELTMFSFLDYINFGPMEIICYFKDEKYRSGIAGSFTTTHNELRDAQEPFTLTNPVYKGGMKVCGQFELVKRTELTMFSFLDYINFGTVLHFAFAVDFSSSEASPDRESQLSFANNVEFAIRSVGETFADYSRSNSFAAYGFGARIPPLYRESHEFCLNLETDPACAGVEGVVAAFRTTYMQTQPCTSAHFAHVIYHLANRQKNGTMFIPMSFAPEGIGDHNLDEVERLGAGGRRLVFQGRRSDRDNLHFVNMTKVLLECDGSAEESKFTLSEKSLFQIPRQIAAFFTKNGILPVDKRETSPKENTAGAVYRSSSILDVEEVYACGSMDHSELLVVTIPFPQVNGPPLTTCCFSELLAVFKLHTVTCHMRWLTASRGSGST
ncbi:unnamed protein product [Nippostrongylus brasiliensis]|uniref:Copine domain-containing protein n=1 Tax=Nippostrongylus brasiliensis TaxID=27835 RepID=A0A158R2Y2_NIPBR|nr:unnamed protein product [Nippostrongylus brasiliensis]